MAGAGAELPTSLVAAWRNDGERRPADGRRGLSPAGIVAAAMEIASEGGLDAVSMNRVATRLGSAPMSLYRHIASKDDLLRLMADAAYGRPSPAPPDESWRDGLARWATEQRVAMRRNPWVLRIPITGPPITPNQVAWLDQGLYHLRDTGLSSSERLSVLLLTTGYVRSEATQVADVDAAIAAAGTNDQAAMASYGEMLRQLIDPVRFPSLATVLATGVLDRADDPDDEFTFGLNRILDGVAAIVERRS